MSFIATPNWNITYRDWWAFYFKHESNEIYLFINGEDEDMAKMRFKELYPGKIPTRIRIVNRTFSGFLSSYSVGQRIK